MAPHSPRQEGSAFPGNGAVTRNRALVLAALALLFALSLTGLLEKGLNLAGADWLRQTNATYLNETSTRATAGFLTLSALKTVLDIIEGSTAGAQFFASASIQVGDVVQAVYDYVDFAWRALLASMLILYGLRVLLEVTDALADPVLTITLSLFLLGQLLVLLRRSPELLRRTVRTGAHFLLVLALTLKLLLPLSIYGASLLSAAFTRPIAEKSQVELRAAQQSLFPESFLRDFRDQSLRENINEIKNKIEEISRTLLSTTERLVRVVIGQVAAYLFDCVIFPLGLFLILLRLTRGLLGQVLEAERHRRLREDLAAMLSRPAPPTHPGDGVSPP